MATVRKPSNAAGAVMQRSLIQAKIARLLKANASRVVGGPQFQRGYDHALEELRSWIAAESKRAALRKKRGVGQ